ncbi:MAG TPA: hypothetical protein VK131_12800 [Candidatus Acidoferrales bacterium]|nr:hypothetical protein [Candidatus Acidoferrales bacterium]
MRSEAAPRGAALAGAAAAALAAAGLLAVLAVVPLQPAPGTIPVLGAGVLALLLLAAVRRSGRLELLAAGGLALAGLAAIAVAPNLLLAALLLLGLAAAQGALPGRRPLAARLRGPALAVLLLGLGDILARSAAVSGASRLAALLLALGLVAAVGLLPYLQELAPGEGLASPTWWLAFCGPVLALALARQLPPLIAPAAAPVFGSLLLGLGLVNAAVGSLAAWLTPEKESAWRYSFVADFGLVMIALGLGPADGRAAAVLLLLTVLLARLPAYAWSRTPPAGSRRLGPLGVLAAALLAGAAPFAGFAGRILLLRGASELYWPLALALALALLLWVPASLRLAQGLSRPTRRQAAGLAALVAVNLALGLYPAPLLALI